MIHSTVEALDGFLIETPPSSDNLVSESQLEAQLGVQPQYLFFALLPLLVLDPQFYSQKLP